MAIVYSTEGIATLQPVLVDSADPPASSVPQDPPRKAQDLDIDQILIAPLGESSPRPHLFVSLYHRIKLKYLLNNDPRSSYVLDNLQYTRSYLRPYRTICHP